MTERELLEKYAGWKVYVFLPRDGFKFCPHCRAHVVSLPGNSPLPPYVCDTDRIFFDVCHDPKVFKTLASVNGIYHRGDLAKMFQKYAVLNLLVM